MFRHVTKRFLQTARPKFQAPSPIATAAKNFNNHIKNEIMVEKENNVKLDLEPLKSLNFDITIQGAAVEMKKNLSETEKATVGFSINGSIPSVNQMEEDMDQEAFSVPDFIIHLEKENHDRVIQYECFFPESNAENLTYNVRALLVMDKNEEDLLEAGEPYYINTDNLDNETFSKIHEYLYEIGFDEDFTQKLVDFSTNLEVNVYIENLEKIHDYLDA